MQDLKNKLMEYVKKFVDVGKQIIEGIKKGIADAWEGLKNWFGEKIKGLVGGVKDLLGIESPSKVFANEVGEWIPAGIAQGIQNGMKTLDNAMDSMSTDLVVGANVTSNTLQNSMPSATEGADGSLYSLLATYLPQIAANGNVNITLDGDAGRLFRLMQRESVRNTQLVGTSSVLSAI
jgi:phage-related protein